MSGPFSEELISNMSPIEKAYPGKTSVRDSGSLTRGAFGPPGGDLPQKVLGMCGDFLELVPSITHISRM